MILATVVCRYNASINGNMNGSDNFFNACVSIRVACLPVIASQVVPVVLVTRKFHSFILTCNSKQFKEFLPIGNAIAPVSVACNTASYNL